MRPDDNEQNVWKSLEAALAYICATVIFIIAAWPVLRLIHPLMWWQEYSQLLQQYAPIAGALVLALIAGRAILKRAT